jgi:phosphatidate cytidylyltransferase
LIGLAAQLGDLSESLIKRDCEVKDSGNLIPGQGGLLDLLDSLLFVAPVVYLYLTYIL